MKNKLANTPTHRQSIQQLINEKKYVGSLSEKGFLLKRNFGNRRLTLFAIINSNDEFEINPKNELVHQIFYIFSYILILALSIFLFFKGEYFLATIILIMIALVGLSDRMRKKKELELFFQQLQQHIS
ncbi:MAG: hypothetical protein Q4G27_11195 [Flavobacteriaceae bacterium]|nr:hypothetical protein [Flavobacteriaceae bacterium]